MQPPTKLKFCQYVRKTRLKSFYESTKMFYLWLWFLKNKMYFPLSMHIFTVTITAAECVHVHHTKKDWTLKDQWYSIIDKNSSESNLTCIYTHTGCQLCHIFSHFQLVKPSFLKVKRKRREVELGRTLLKIYNYSVCNVNSKLIISCFYVWLWR